MLSILVVSPDPSVPGGVSVFVECMKRHIMQSRVDSFFVGSSGKKDESVFSLMKRLILSPIKLVRYVKRFHFDVVHINPSFDAKSLVRDGLYVLALHAVGFQRIMLYFHGWDCRLQRFLMKNDLVRKIVVWILNKSVLITVLDKQFYDGLVSMGVKPSRILVTRTMFEAIAWNETESMAPLRPFILFLSRFDPEKGGRQLIQAFAALAADYPDIDLIMAGDGDDAIFFKEQVHILGLEDRIFFPGYIGGLQKSHLLRSCLFFALPTYYRSEGMPISVLEAMGAGKALLVGSAGALQSIVSEPANGIVLDNITDQTIEAGLRRLLSDPVFLADAGRRNAEKAASEFDAHIVTAEIEKMYQRVAQC